VLRYAFASRAPLLLAGLAALGCSPSYDLGVTTGAGGAASTSSITTGAGGAPTTAGTGGVAEPSGPTALTIVNGINDYAAALFCFLPGDTPWPAAAGLPFATGQAVDLATALPAGADVTVWVVAGDLAATAGMTCTQILALAQPADGGTSPIVATALAVIPQALLTSDKSLLLATTGCMGGSGHDDPNAATNGCGAGYTSGTPTVSVAPLVMSRITDPNRVGLQVVNASALLPTSDVGVLPSLPQAMEVPLAPSLTPGAIGPYPPFEGLALAGYGPLAGVQIMTFVPGSSTVTSSTTLGPVLAASAVGTAGFVDGAGLVLVAVGGAPGVAAGAFWHAFTFALVKASPG
jgi:hypothetical protein